MRRFTQEDTTTRCIAALCGMQVGSGLANSLTHMLRDGRINEEMNNGEILVQWHLYKLQEAMNRAHRLRHEARVKETA